MDEKVGVTRGEKRFTFSDRTDLSRFLEGERLKISKKRKRMEACGNKLRERLQ